MKCAHVKIGEVTAIVCGRAIPARPCIKCRKAPATRLCDWKLGKEAGRATCDRPLCEACTFHPAPGKDLCPRHKTEFDKWKDQQAAAAAAKGTT